MLHFNSCICSFKFCTHFLYFVTNSKEQLHTDAEATEKAEWQQRESGSCVLHCTVHVRSCCCVLHCACECEVLLLCASLCTWMGRIPSAASLAYSWTATEGLISPSSFVCMETAVHTMNMYYVCVTNNSVRFSFNTTLITVLDSYMCVNYIIRLIHVY